MAETPPKKIDATDEMSTVAMSASMAAVSPEPAPSASNLDAVALYAILFGILGGTLGALIGNAIVGLMVREPRIGDGKPRRPSYEA